MSINKEIKQKKFENEWQKAIVNLHFTSNFFKDQLIAILKPYKINDQHYNILRILKGCYPNAICPGDIKAVLINKRGDLTRLLDKLEKLGHVERAINPNNRRSIDVKITLSGIQLLKALKATVDIMDQAKSNLTQQEAAQLSILLDKLRQ